jgi:glycosyltransferase involved in cell wall biosynthesis
MSVLESLACETPVVVSDIENYDKDYIEADETVVAVDRKMSSNRVPAWLGR